MLVAAELLALDGALRESFDQVVAVRAGIDFLVKRRAGGGGHLLRKGVRAWHQRRPLSAGVCIGRFPAVEFRGPGGQCGEVICAADKRAGFGIEPIRAVGFVAHGQNGAAVLERDADDAGLAVPGRLHLVAHGINQQAARRSAARLAVGKELRVVVGHAGYDLAGGAVVPLVGSDAAAARRGAGQEGRVTDGRDRRAVHIVGARKNGAVFEQTVESRAVIRAESGQVVITELVDDNSQHEFRLLRRGGKAGQANAE